MSKARILRMALDEIVGGVKKVDLGDLTKKVNVGDRMTAIGRMLGDAGEAAAKKADDWGWKGGKPGEITGIEYEKLPKTRKLEEKVGKQYLAASSKGKLPLLSGQEDVDRLMLDFATLERADIPRQWTGKVMRAHRGSLIDNAADELGIRPDDVRFLSADDRFSTEVNYASKLSDLMRPMTNDQRETFLALLPEWSGTLNELAEAARNL